MIESDIRQKIRHIEIHTRRLITGTLVGDSRSAIKGSGFEFDQIREYQMGDDVRTIDWKSSARNSKHDPTEKIWQGVIWSGVYQRPVNTH